MGQSMVDEGGGGDSRGGAGAYSERERGQPGRDAVRLYALMTGWAERAGEGVGESSCRGGAGGRSWVNAGW